MVATFKVVILTAFSIPHNLILIAICTSHLVLQVQVCTKTQKDL